MPVKKMDPGDEYASKRAPGGRPLPSKRTARRSADDTPWGPTKGTDAYRAPPPNRTAVRTRAKKFQNTAGRNPPLRTRLEVENYFRARHPKAKIILKLKERPEADDAKPNRPKAPAQQTMRRPNKRITGHASAPAKGAGRSRPRDNRLATQRERKRAPDQKQNPRTCG